MSHDVPQSRLHAWDVAKREDRWHFDYPKGAARLASTDGERIFQPAGNAVHAVKAADGTEVWKDEFSAQIRMYGPMVRDGRVVSVRGPYGPATVECLDAATGKQIWTALTGSRASQQPAMTEDEVLVPVMMEDGIDRFSLKDGTRLGRFKTPIRPDSTIAVSPNRIYIGGQKMVAALDRKTGAVVWKQDYSGDIAFLAIAGDKLLVARLDGFLDALGAAPAPAPPH